MYIFFVSALQRLAVWKRYLSFTTAALLVSLIRTPLLLTYEQYSVRSCSLFDVICYDNVGQAKSVPPSVLIVVSVVLEKTQYVCFVTF